MKQGLTNHDLHERYTKALLRHRGCEVPKDRDWSSVQFGEIAADDVRAILATNEGLHHG